ncbi:hypothetical protein NPD8_3205 [Clostridium botulinum]|nr:hypothetical protein NPD8_3205 [Clostridium botulinum]
MKTKIYNLSVERMKQSEFDVIYNEFTSLGWEYNGNWDLAKVHTFIQFAWNKSSDPIYPKGFEPNKDVDQIDLDKFPRPR